MKILVVVDVQNDFISGTLGGDMAQKAISKIADYIRTQADKDTILLLTKDTHSDDYMDTLEGKRLPLVHCIRDTYGWEFAPEICEALYDTRDKYNDDYESYFPYVNEHIIEKRTFGSLDLQNFLYALTEDDDALVEEITFVGIDTAICVLSNVILARATLPNVPIKVVADCCASVNEETHQTALNAMKMCQIDII